MTPYILALAALALLLACTARKKRRGNGYQPKVIGNVINAKEDEDGLTLTISLADTELIRKMSLRQKFNAETDTHGFSCATQPKKNNNRKKEN